MGFEWDTDKSAANEAKHGITFLQAAQIFRGPILKSEDGRRDYGEQRFIGLGEHNDVVLRVVFTERGEDIRIISAWKAGRHDREKYQSIR
jgi:uncharacterized DUF497 family protein